MKLILWACGVLISTRAFAVGYPPKAMGIDAMRSELAHFQSTIADTPCKGLLPVSGVLSGGGLPGSDVHYEVMQLALEGTTNPSAQLMISWGVVSPPRSAKPKTTISFECSQLN
jgi:hypothetical protein